MLQLSEELPSPAAAAIAVIDTFKDEEILANIQEMESKSLELLTELSKKHPMIQQIRGKGLMLGIVLDREAKEASELAEKNGLLIITAGENVLRFYPPLNIKESELIEAVSILDKVMSKLD